MVLGNKAIKIWRLVDPAVQPRNRVPVVAIGRFNGDIDRSGICRYINHTGGLCTLLDLLC